MRLYIPYACEGSTLAAQASAFGVKKAACLKTLFRGYSHAKVELPLASHEFMFSPGLCGEGTVSSEA